jgi:hypothetical protein
LGTVGSAGLRLAAALTCESWRFSAGRDSRNGRRRSGATEQPGTAVLYTQGTNFSHTNLRVTVPGADCAQPPAYFQMRRSPAERWPLVGQL